MRQVRAQMRRPMICSRMKTKMILILALDIVGGVHEFTSYKEDTW